MTRSITARNVFEKLQHKLKLHWLSQEVEGYSLSADDLTARPDLVGFLNLIHPNRFQVLGSEEIEFLGSLAGDEMASTVDRIFSGQPLAIIVGDGMDMPAPLLAEATGNRTALMRSELPAHELVNYLQYYVAHAVARRTTLHGVFMEIFTIGVLITGDAGSGKSELALELLNRGHRLIADDAPEFTQITPEIIEGTCPEALQDCLEVRGLGILNVRRMFGDAAVKLNKFLRLIVQLEIPDDPSGPDMRDRLRGDESTMQVLGMEIPSIRLPVIAGRNLAVITEAAVRDFMLKMKGYDAAAVFIERHARLLERQTREGYE